MRRLPLILVAALVLAVAGPAFAKGNGPGPGPGGRGPAPVVMLDPDETADLVFLREEEKLARDSYLWLFNRWGEPVFARIADSERRHMAALAKKLDMYGVPDPITDDSPGAFTFDSGLGPIYAGLILQGDASLLEAYRVGAWIEEADISDLLQAIENTDEAALISVYGNLLEGSRKHLQAFIAHINALGYSYEPQMLSQGDLNALLENAY